MKSGLLFAVLLITASIAFGQSATVIAENANLRGTPSQSGKVVDTIAQNTVVEIIKQRSAWYLVQTADYAGWLHGNTIRLNSSLTVSSVDDSGSRDMIPARPTYSAPPPARVTSPPPSSGRSYIRGPRGGCYYWNRNGNKTYVDRSLCN